ncbi:AAA family ATPase [Nonomuraea phyllanthi]|uniref:BTAD domain-containing putative transcriptional regulator n=1 Tax=Nonomuraea phyllanthi TaxID=2219224 RepID=UPI0012937316|nr:BTAD domain-containing putative transcriptional regulator [Nonomuraea phyllanthi]QFY12132.1 AAA family ATPase [Nonomuraea phyllanthi]
MRFGVLGQVQVWTADGMPVAVPEVKVRALLADLLVHPGQVVSADRLIDDLWGDDLPANPMSALQLKVSRLRRALDAAEPGGGELVCSRTPGYLLDVDAEAVDAAQFAILTSRAWDMEDLQARAGLLADALALWRGPAFADFADNACVRSAVVRLEEQRLAAVEAHAEARLELGEHGPLVGELGDLVMRYPLRERLRAVQMRALYRAGRQAEALAGYGELRERLAEELGLDPSPELVALHQAILEQSPALSGPVAGPHAAEPVGTGAGNIRRMPAEVSSFVGREHELAVGKALLARARLVTLTGVGGVGKTRLALRLASELAPEFRHNVCLVDLAPLQDEELLASTVAATLGVGGQTMSSPLAHLCGYLADKQVLMVLDNCEHLIDACASLAATLLTRAAELRILATSRQPLGIEGESILPVPPLEVPPSPVSLPAALGSKAVQLFVDRVVAVCPGFTVTEHNSDVVAGVCRRLDGIPLAMELAAVQARALPVEGIRARLDHRFDLLAKRRRGVLPRHQTLRAAIEWSYEMCSAAEKLLWARMSVFAGGCDLEAIEDVCTDGTITRENVYTLVADLVDKSIIFHQENGTQPRYRLLETIREFGEDLLASSGELAQMRARHGDYYRRLVLRASSELFGPRQVDWLIRLQREKPNLRTALEYSFSTPGLQRAGLETATTLNYVWIVTGAVREGSHWLERGLELNPDATHARAAALGARANLLIFLGNLDAALEAARESRALGEQLDDPRVRAWADMCAGAARIYSGDLPAALHLLQQAVAEHRRLDDPFALRSTLWYLSLAAAGADDPPAVDYGQEYLAICQSHGAEMSTSWAQWVVGLGLIRRGDVDRGAAHIRESLRPKARFDDLTGIALCIEALAWAAAITLETERAARLFGAAHSLWRKAGSSLVECVYLQRFRAPYEKRARDALGDDAYTVLFDEGQELNMDDAIRYALQEQAPEPPATVLHSGESALPT